MSKRVVLLLTCSSLLGACTADRLDGGASRSSTEIDAEVDRLRAVVASGGGDAEHGRAMFVQRCGACHTLHDTGGQVGPDLTPYLREREHLDFILRSIVTPDVMVHEYHPTIAVRTRDGAIHLGTVEYQNRDSVVLIMPGSRQMTLVRSQIDSIEPRNESLMPAQLLTGLSDTDVRDLFEYILRP